MITVKQVGLILAAPKTVVRPISWSKKLNRENPAWQQFETAISFDEEDSEVVEGVSLKCLWRPQVGIKPAVSALGLFIDDARAYAIDVAPLGRHKNNKAGRDRPMYGNEIDGIHEHTWSDDGGYGYAEPWNGVEISDFSQVWPEFLRRSNIKYIGKFIHPDQAKQAGQGGFDI